AALGAVLALGIATEPAARRSVRMLAAATLVPLPLTLFFTFSRGAWVALGGGVLVLVSCSPRRMRVLVEGAALALAPTIAMVLAARSQALTDQDAVLRAARAEGHRLAWIVLLLAAASAVLIPVLTAAERSIVVSRRVARALELALAVACTAVLAAVVV